MASMYTKLALYGNTKKCAWTDTVFLPISEVCNGRVSLSINWLTLHIGGVELGTQLFCYFVL